MRWGDFRTPASTPDAITARREAHERAETGRVEVACGGGVGRTGTALAAPEAVAWARRAYHRRAVETPWQKRWVLSVRPP